MKARSCVVGEISEVKLFSDFIVIENVVIHWNLFLGW